MRIIVPTSSFPSCEDDGAGRFVLDLSRGLAELGYEVHHVVPAFHHGQGPPLSAGLSLGTFPVGWKNWGHSLVHGAGIGVNLKRSPHLLMAVPALLAGFKRALRAELQLHPDAAVLSHWAFPAGYAASCVVKPGTTHVSVVHGGGMQALMRLPRGGVLLRRWCRGVSGIHFVSRDLHRKAQARLSQDLPEHFHVAPMGIDPDRFAPESGASERDFAFPEHQLLLLGVGRLIALKGFDLLIRAAAELPDVLVVLAGRGPEEGRLRRLAEKLGVSLVLTGNLPPADLSKLYRAADLLVIPSGLGRRGRSEGSPMVALEAMSQGLPVVASATGGLSDLVTESQAGRTFPVNESHALVTTLRELWQQPSLRLSMKEKGIRFSQEHRYDVLARRIEHLLRKSRKA